MNEEEKKAIERIDYIQDFVIENGQYNADVNDMECFSKILILIEKQQKEIERLKQVEQAHKEENGKLRVELEKEKNKNKVIEIFREDMPKDTEIICMRKEDFERNFKSDYISKDKIKEKLNKLKEEQKEYKGSQEWEIQDDILAQVMILEELLEEK